MDQIFFFLSAGVKKGFDSAFAEKFTVVDSSKLKKEWHFKCLCQWFTFKGKEKLIQLG